MQINCILYTLTAVVLCYRVHTEWDAVAVVLVGSSTSSSSTSGSSTGSTQQTGASLLQCASLVV